jgi:hypothetical protein
MRKSRVFRASGFDALEGRVVLSHFAATAPGVIHGHKAQLVAADFANFQSSFNSTITPIVKDLQNANAQNQYQQAGQDYEAINTAINGLVNGLGNQLAKQLHGKFYWRIRSVVTGASAPSSVGFASSTPSSGSLLATLNTMDQTSLGSPGIVSNLVVVYQNALISGHTATKVSGDFASFRTSFEKTISPLAQAASNSQVSQNQQLDAAIISLVNGLGDQLSKDLGTSAQPTIRALITGSSASSGVDYTTGTPVAGSLLATLMSVQTTDLSNWDFVNDLISVYSSSSRTFT